MRSRPSRILTAATATLGAALILSACTASEATPQKAAGESGATTVMITDNHGEVEVPVNPETVVALDNTSFDTLDEWDIELAAVPKGVMGTAWPDYTDDDDIIDVGNHREPDLEAIVAAQPDLIIGGYRFAEAYDQIKEQNPDAAIIEIAPREGEDQFEELKRQTEILGQIFDREDEATELSDGLDASVAAAGEAYNGEDSVMAVNTSAGQIGYIAPEVGRAIGPVFPALGWQPALEVEGATDDHQGDQISVEAIAESNPDWIIALDRDAAFIPEEREAGSVPAHELIAQSEALQSVTAVQQDQIVILDPNFYLTEGIQAYTELFNLLEESFSAA